MAGDGDGGRCRWTSIGRVMGMIVQVEVDGMVCRSETDGETGRYKYLSELDVQKHMLLSALCTFMYSQSILFIVARACMYQ